jgi:hypothetical protein
MTDDAYTMELELCGADGLVDLAVHNRLCRLGGHPEWKHEQPFLCTGSAHLAGEHVRCTSRYHVMPPRFLDSARVDAAHVLLLAKETRAFLADADADDPDVASLLASASAAERVAGLLLASRPVNLSYTTIPTRA